MAVIGTATLNVVPKFPGLSAAVKSELGKVDAKTPGAKAGSDYGHAMGGGLARSGAVIGAFSAVTAKAMDLVASHVGAAASRFDTLNNYPKVMQQLGYSAKDSEASIATMSDRLSTLPTTLDAMTTTVSGLVAITHDLPKATEAGLALNDMLIASGSSQQLVNAAMEQFRQMLSKGKPEMEDWRSLVTAAPGQMDQLAKSMLGPTASANELYAALGGGKNDPILSMDELLDAIVRLDAEGGEGFASFREQAQSAAGGVQTAMANAGNAITKGLAGTLEAVGRERISGAFDEAKGGINDLFAAVNGGVSKAMPQVDRLAGHVRKIGPEAVTVAAGFAVFNAAGGMLANVASNAKAATRETTMLGQVSRMLGPSVSPASVAIGGLSAVLAVAAYGYMDAKKKSDNFEKSTRGLSDAVKKAANLDQYAGKIAGVGESAGITAMRLDELRESAARHVDKINETNEKAETQIAQLNTAQGVIEAYTGQTDLSTDAQGRLEWALKLVNDQFGLTLTAADVAAGAYENAEGATVDLKDSINDLIEAKKQEIKITAMSADLDEATAMQREAADSYAVARRLYDEKLEYYKDYYRREQGMRGEAADAAAAATADEISGLSAKRAHYEEYSKAVEDMYAGIGDAAQAASESADEFDRWGNSLGPVFESVLKDGGTSIAALKDDMRSLGVDTEQLEQKTEDELLKLAGAYDGTASSVVGALKEIGVGMDEDAEQAAAAADAVKSALDGMGEGVRAAADGIGFDLRTLASELSNAGVSSEQLSSVAQEDFAEMLAACGGDIAALTGMIGIYNSTPVVDKEGNVNVEAASLMDAQGNVYTWNGTEFADKDGTAVVDDTSLTDSQGNLYLWNGSSLVDQYGNAFVQDGVPAAQQHLDRWNASDLDDQTGSGLVSGNMEYANGQKAEWNRNGLASWVGEGIINITKTITEFFSGGSRNAAGGIRLNAAGGYRFHGAGAIATKAMPLDIVGEDGAEAIVPLTNKRYSAPFAKTLAEQMGAAGGGLTKADVYDAMVAALSSAGIANPAVYVDGREITNALAPRMGARLGRIEQRRSNGL
ncbi:tape measure protein [Eggerthella lenta]|uniref:Tape measure protein n=1 Tax=Eggerthella lenta TaxID=84112 RepID=A0A5C5BT52_EGGLN|nr:tape measure protein [Eggerthella lenta]TNU89387.1 tape measure protein [Eggerthella lenta]